MHVRIVCSSSSDYWRMQHNLRLACRETINTGPGIQGLVVQRLGTWWSCSVALSFYGRNATWDNVLSSNVWLYHCGLQSLHCYTQSRQSSFQIVLFHTICYFTLSASFLCLFFTLPLRSKVYCQFCKVRVAHIKRESLETICISPTLRVKEVKDSVVCYK